MKKLIYAFCALALIFTSCSKDSTPDNNSSNVLLKTATYSDGRSSTYTYNDKKIVKVTDSDGRHTDFIYSGNLITNVKNYDSSNVLEAQDIYTYDTQGNLSSYVYLDLINDDGTKEVQTINTDGTISTINYSGNVDSQTVLSGYFKYFHQNGEISKVEEYDASNNLTITRTFTYDSKKNPLKNVIGYAQTLGTDGYSQGATYNVLSEVETGSSSSTTSYQYTYNSNDFPTSSSYLYNGADASTTQYSY